MGSFLQFDLTPKSSKSPRKVLGETTIMSLNYTESRIEPPSMLQNNKTILDESNIFTAPKGDSFCDPSRMNSFYDQSRRNEFDDYFKNDESYCNLKIGRQNTSDGRNAGESLWSPTSGAEGSQDFFVNEFNPAIKIR